MSAYVNRLDKDFQFAVILKLSGIQFGHDIILVCSYIFPEGSNRYVTEQNGIEILKEKMTELKAEHGDSKLVVMGDLNARIGHEQDFIWDDNVTFMNNMDWYEVDTFDVRRHSKDNVVNKFGKSLIEMCCE